MTSDERLLELWRVTGSLLRQAAADLTHTPEFAECDEFLQHNELELALDVLEEAGHHHEVPPTFWRNLKEAAEVMGLRDRSMALAEQARLVGGPVRPIDPEDQRPSAQ